MAATLALTRQVPSTITRCELTHLGRAPIDLERARAQHADLGRLLARLGCEVRELPEDPAHPDSVFVEDTAIVLDEVAVLTRPGAASRRGELPAIEAELAKHRELVRIEAPATLDGGDVLACDRTIFVGLSSRTTEAGTRALADRVGPFGYTVVPVPVRDCLHFKSAVTRVAEDRLLVQPAWVDPADLDGWDTLAVGAGEDFGANTVRVHDTLILPTGFPRTCEVLEGAGLRVETVDASELAKAEGGVSCCSLLIERGA